ncbi:MAG TPA: hypothetical protein VG965_05770 [Patescibacteria group bacterium]|nr:hypothetical protein [Patescibacteria group bacterium]
MATYESETQVTAERTAEQDVKFNVVRNLKFGSLLPLPNGKPFGGETVTAYRYQQGARTEYLIVFGPLSGYQLYKRLNDVARVKDEFDGVRADFSGILSSAELWKRHNADMPEAWAEYASSIQRQNDVMQTFKPSGLPIIPHQAYMQLERARNSYSALAEHQSQADNTVDKAYNQATRMLSGDMPVDIQFISHFLQISSSDIGMRGVSRGDFTRLVNGFGSPKIREQFLNRFKKVVAEKSRDENGDLDKTKLRSYAEQTTTTPKGLIRKKIDDKYFLYPTHLEPYLNSWHVQQISGVQLNENGEFVIPPDAKEKVDAEIKRLDGDILRKRSIIPIIRFAETDQGVSGFVFSHSEASTPLPSSVLKDIDSSTAREALDTEEFHEGWLSGAVGNLLLIGSHPKIKEINDSWSRIWQRTMIRRSEAAGLDSTLHEPLNINGPVQVGLIATVALARYPQHFNHFKEAVKNQFGRIRD